MSLLLFVTIIAVLYSGWNQAVQRREIAALRDRLTAVEKDARIRARINDLYEYFDTDDSAKMETFDLVRHLVPKAPNLSLPLEEQVLLNALRSNVQLADVDGKPGGLEILSLSNIFHVNPGSDYSINALFNDQRIVEVLVRHTGTRMETHDVELVDAMGDNRVDLVLNCSSGFLSSENAGRKLIYSATEKGFSPAWQD